MTPKAYDLVAYVIAYLGRRSVRSLLLFVLAFTLIPVFLISFGQAYLRLAHDREVVRENLIDNVSLSAEQASHVIRSAERALVGLSARKEVRDVTQDCAKTLAIAQSTIPYVSNLARIGADGMITCSAISITMNPDLRRTSWLAELSPVNDISFAGPILARPNSTPTLIIGLGLRDTNGKSLGHIVVGINLEALEAGLQEHRGRLEARLTLVDKNGDPVRRIIANPPPDTLQEIQIETKILAPGAVTAARDKDGKIWTYARATLVADRLFVAYTMPDKILYSSTFRHVATDIALPLIALIFAGAGLWFAIQLWAIAPILSLRTLAKQYSVGRFDAEAPALKFGPNEMKELRDELTAMAARATHRDERLKRVANQKDELVKELHHRVKNNLQIVISLIGLQARQTNDPLQKLPLERVHARIMAMALVERLIVETDKNPTIDVSMLLEEICGLVRRLHPAVTLRVKLNLKSAHFQLPVEKANPLALFAFEAITNAFRHGFSPSAHGHIEVTFILGEAQTGRLNVLDSGTGWNELNKETGTGHSLLKAFSRQLGGQFSLSTTPTDGSQVSLTFPLPPLSDAAQRELDIQQFGNKTDA